jgi:hypothetical protein
LFVGFVLLTAGVVGLATIQPSDSTRAIIFTGLAGFGFGGPLVLIITGVQLSTPHHLIATATAVTTSTRAVSATVFTAIYAATLNSRLNTYIPSYIAEAAVLAGLPVSSLPTFIKALATNDAAGLSSVLGLTPQAFADGIRAVFMIAASFSVVACITCYFLGSVKDTMNYHVDAPVEDLHAKQRHEEEGYALKNTCYGNSGPKG